MIDQPSPTRRLTVRSPPPPGLMLAEDDCCAACAVTPADPQWARAARSARALSWVSLLWMSGEGVLGLVAGLQASSISLVGWALGSVIEGLASIIVIWRFTGARTFSETAEHRAQKAVAVSFFLLAPYIAIEAIRDLAGDHHVQASVLGMLVTASSLLVMPGLGVTKKRLGTRLGSGATAGEGIQNLLCAAQAGAVLIGLAATAAFGWRWLDPMIALLLAAWAVREGVEAWRGEECC